MSDDATYAAFLQKANSHVPQDPKTKKSQSDITSKLYLVSESDEPWEDFSLKKNGALLAAQAFAELVKVSGDARYVDASVDAQYAQAIDMVRQSSPRKHEETQCIEIEEGTRIVVYIFYHDEKEGMYRGLKSKKIQS
ncbi:protein of unknown function [Taphrina deformans PYCC 5710]|uniref:Uncharacterized protein n=1 Tax=Taphrina deformans (strain PYCC 5710 / ATCC 11124 / CBS 356.35 / IMI 108563 / JCM 9778 / NBRC 8474) TaxID=1097556 RepID=R4XBF1_TAPDE|nr:protein of unknown function [Taphrina deformans PYCC 5710]|eukprot:CCG80663.1 protein of unknown function [Taphrina deformans PYCC 5710]